MKFDHAILDNGLTVIGEQRESAVSTAIGFFVKTGARDETKQISGVSHFLEHMLFKGTESRSALDITYQMGAIGAQANAFTSEESTVYYMAVLPEYFQNALELLSDMMRPSLDPAEFLVEKKVILEEIALYKDRPTYMLLESALATFFDSHPAGNSVLGSIESISALTRDQMAEYFNERYQPSNIVLTASGNFNFKELCSLAEKYCGHWSDMQVGRNRPPLNINKDKLVAKQLTKSDLNRAHVMLLAPGPDVRHKYRYEADVLSTIIGDHSGSRIFWELIDKGLADSASIESEQMDGVGVFYGYASTTPEALPQVSDILSNVMSTPLEFSDEDLDRAITKTATRLVLQGESSMRRMMTCGFDWMYGGEYISLEEELRRTKAVTRNSIENLVKQFDFKPSHKVSLVPAL
ncbi:MAG TPA: pitrilysin family protein [Oligoflexia bacterium]|nr:pitrilysin family protein [Oligoflexia bacterium]HMP48992.1 pitrilysin family protein [Oligoflexia bacterium]